MKNVFRVQGGGFCGVPREETTSCLEVISAPAVVLSREQHEERERRLRANFTQQVRREYYPAPPCILAIEEE